MEQLNLPYTFVTDSLSVHSRYGIAVIVIGCHDFRSRFCEKKDFAHNFYRCMQRAKWKGLFVACKYLLGLFLLFDGVSVMVQEFLFGIDVCHFFTEVKLFLTLILLDIQNSLRSPIHAAIYGVCCLTAWPQSNVVCLTVWSKSFIYFSAASCSGLFLPSRKTIISTEDPSRQQFLSWRFSTTFLILSLFYFFLSRWLLKRCLTSRHIKVIWVRYSLF